MAQLSMGAGKETHGFHSIHAHDAGLVVGVLQGDDLGQLESDKLAQSRDQHRGVAMKVAQSLAYQRVKTLPLQTIELDVEIAALVLQKDGKGSLVVSPLVFGVDLGHKIALRIQGTNQATDGGVRPFVQVGQFGILSRSKAMADEMVPFLPVFLSAVERTIPRLMTAGTRKRQGRQLRGTHCDAIHMMARRTNHSSFGNQATGWKSIHSRRGEERRCAMRGNFVQSGTLFPLDR